ncbi:alpha/beta hydrolase family protein [Streptomyces sp. Ag109_O5-1]|uniref:alpha/beta fold hydrolase n=1 Tax=Streptomyces sp. Ag109_O5-1 TaxID=1938851 RepID=UPI000F4E977E|nr:alpha/beta fold hydrolase [Streptomyces sp. Ag109_O5-1]RPE37389.1 alpha/beta hydrolase family protein [Streptomyces sp. Ag109_O5-1]
MATARSTPEEADVDAVGDGRAVEADGSALVVRRAPRDRARGAVLVLHGGQEKGRQAARPWQPAALRMRPFLGVAASVSSPREVLIGHVRYRYRGWNEGADPLQDTLRALDELRVLAGDVPVVLIGHSMGGRAALRAAGDPSVRGVLALAPWCPPGDPVVDLAGTRILVLHGDRDRVTEPAESAAYVRQARGAGAEAGMVLLRGSDHAMLRRSRDWHRASAAAIRRLLHPERDLDGWTAEACGTQEPLLR